MNSFRTKLRRRTKKSTYSKKSRRFNRKRKITRKHFKRQHKKHRHKMKGGEVFRGSDQGCSFWPSIFPADEESDKIVTKVFYNNLGSQNGALKNEEAGYAIFDRYDPEYLFHARKFSSGPCSTEILIGTLCENDPSYRVIAPTTYINTEYVGTSLRTTQIRSKSFKIQLISFFIHLLHLRQNDQCLIFRDLNGGNICYICHGEECTFKCIDVGGVFELNAKKKHIEPREIRDINDQFMNIHYLVLEGLQNFTMPVFAYVAVITYEDNLAMEIQKLQDALNYITATDETALFKNQSETASGNTTAFRPNKPKSRKSIFSTDDEAPPSRSSKTSSSMFGDEEGSPFPSFKPPSKMFGDSDGSPFPSFKPPSSKMFDSDDD